MRGGYRVAQSALHLFLRFQRCRDRRLHVAEVVERIEDAEHVDAALGRVSDEQLDHVVGKVAIGEQVLSPDQRLDRGVGRGLGQVSEILPRVLAAADLRFKCRSTESLHGCEADRIHLRGYRHYLVTAQLTAQQ